jgi:hypothetical protein
MMKRRSLGFKLSLIAAVCCFPIVSIAQQSTASTVASSTASAVPRVVNYSGMLKDLSGKPLTGITGVTFLLYKESQGGSPLWMETQNVQPTSGGHYSVTLGSTTSAGLPADVFVSGEARWLGVQVQGQNEQPRVLLVAVPYALKSGDAETLGGLPASAFLLAAPPSSAATSSGAAADGSSTVLPPPATITGTGTAGFLPDFTGAATIGNSAVFQSGASPTAKIGINTNAPTTNLDVHGGAAVRGTFVLPSTGTATAVAGKSSQAESLGASAFNSGTSTAVAQTFQLKAEPVGNNTATASASLNFLFGQGIAAPTETGLSISSKGLFSFAAGQTFPGTGTITGITTAAGSGLTGGGTTGNLSVKLLGTCGANQILKWTGAAWACAADNNSGGTVTSVGLSAPGSDFTVGGSPVTGSGTLALGWSVTPTNANTANAIVKRDASGNFAGNIVSANDVEVNSIDSTPIGDFAYSAFENDFVADQFFAGNGAFMYVGDPGCGSGWAAIGFQGLSGCSNYSLLGDGIGTYLNSPAGGTIHFRNGNTEFMSQDSNGALVINSNGDGVFATSLQATGNGVVGIAETGSDPFGVWGQDTSGFGFAVVSTGPALVTGDLTVEGAIFAGTKDFRIDHPLDPANKYLYHASVESSEMMNIYTGNVTTDAQGEATVKMPSWFEAINTDFRYQLTVMGQFAQAIVGRKIENNQFTIRTSVPNVEVSWQVTGVRHDAYATAHPLVVEQAKSGKEAGYYIHPELYGQSEKKGMMWGQHREKMLAMQQRQAKLKESRGVQQPSAHPKIVASRAPILRKAAAQAPLTKK